MVAPILGQAAHDATGTPGTGGGSQAQLSEQARKVCTGCWQRGQDRSCGRCAPCVVSAVSHMVLTPLRVLQRRSHAGDAGSTVSGRVRNGAGGPGTSRRCRAGAATAARCRAAVRRSPGPPGSSAAASSRSYVVPLGEHRLHDAGRLGEHRGAGHVGHHAAGADRVERRGQQRALQRHQVVDVGLGAPPPGLGPPAQRAQPGARRVDEDPVERRRRARRGGCRRRPPRRAARRRPSRSRPRPARPGAPAARRRAAGPPRSRPAPRAARTCRRGRRTGRASARRGPRPRRRDSATATSWEPSSWTPARPSATAATAPGSPESSVTAYGDSADAVPPAATSSSTVDSPGRATRVTLGGALSAAEQVVELVGAVAERLGERRDDPARVRVRHGREADRVGGRVGGDPAHPAGQVVGGDLAQHRVHEAGRSLADLGPHQVDAGADRGVRRAPASRAAGGCPAAARRAPRRRPWPAAGPTLAAITAS